MKKVVFIFLTTFVIISIALASVAEAKGKKGSKRVGGYNSHGKGSHYIGGR